MKSRKFPAVLSRMKKNDRRSGGPVSKIVMAALVLASTAGFVSGLSRNVFNDDAGGLPGWVYVRELFSASLPGQLMAAVTAANHPAAPRSVTRSVSTVSYLSPSIWLEKYGSRPVMEPVVIDVEPANNTVGVNANGTATFDPNLFNVATSTTVPVSPKTSGQVTAALNTAYFWQGAAGTQWNVNANWSPSTAFPNGQGDSALNIQTVNASVTQSTPGGVTVGTIGHDAVNVNTSWAIATTTPITLDQDAGGPLSATIRNTNASATTGNSLSITGLGGLILADNLSVTNSGGSTNTNGSIQLSTIISGTGNITFTNASNNVSAGQIAVNAANTFTGSSTIATGAVTFNNNTSFGVAANTINLGMTGGGSASLVSSASVTLANPIVTATGSGGTLVLGGKNATQTTYSGTVTLNDSVTLTSATTVASGAARTTAFTNTISGTGGVTVTGTSNAIGFVSLSGANTYQGGTNVNSGTLLVSNASGSSATGSGAVMVNNSGTLGGTGFINAGANDVTINGGGNITGGTNGVIASTGSIGSLTLTATNVVFNGASAGSLATYIVDLTAATSDRLIINGNLNLSTTFDQLIFQGVTGAASYTIATYTGTRTGIFDVVTPPAGYAVSYAIPGEIDLVAVPEPSTWIGGALALAAIVFTQRRRLRGLIARN